MKGGMKFDNFDYASSLYAIYLQQYEAVIIL